MIAINYSLNLKSVKVYYNQQSNLPPIVGTQQVPSLSFRDRLNKFLPPVRREDRNTLFVEPRQLFSVNKYQQGKLKHQIRNCVLDKV